MMVWVASAVELAVSEPETVIVYVLLSVLTTSDSVLPAYSAVRLAPAATSMKVPQALTLML